VKKRKEKWKYRMREHGEKILRVPGDLLDRIFSIDSFEEYAEFIEISFATIFLEERASGGRKIK